MVSGMREPGGEGGEFFVLGPGGSERFAETAYELGEDCGFAAKRDGCGGQEFAFLDGGDGEVGLCAGVEQGFAEEFTVGGVNEGMRREDLGEFGEWATGSKKKSGAR